MTKEIETGVTLLSFEQVALGYGHKKVLSDLNFSIQLGDYLGIVGPNGAGKTTLLRAIFGVLSTQEGTIHRRGNGNDLRFGYVPQRQTIDEHYPLSTFEMVMMGRYHQIGVLRRPKKLDRTIVQRSLEQVGIANLSRQLYRELSGGQKQRALVARALATEPDVLILDEPTNDMDIAGEHAIMELIDGLHEQQMTMVMVSHMLNVVINHVHRLALIVGGRAEVGTVGEILSEQRLQQLYGTALTVTQVDGKQVVI